MFDRLLILSCILSDHITNSAESNNVPPLEKKMKLTMQNLIIVQKKDCFTTPTHKFSDLARKLSFL